MTNSLYAIFLFLFPFSLYAQEKNAAIVNPQAEFYVASDFTKEGIFTGGIEGPAVDAKGNLYAVNYSKDGTIGIMDSIGNAKIFATLSTGRIGNGIRFDKQENMYIADYPGHTVQMIPAGKNIAETYCYNKSFNQPNDLAIMSNGILFASDPNWSNSTGKIWRIGKDKIAVLLEANMGTTNGIEVSPDDKYLYVNESAQKKIWRYDLTGTGEISNKTLFASFNDYSMDGMRCDILGNLYVTRYGKGTIAILSPEGTLLREVLTKGTDLSNIAFGGKDGKTCFVTLQDRKMVEMFRTEIPGREWYLFQPVTGSTFENGKTGRVEVFPNPSTSRISLKNLDPDSMITVIDVKGNKIYSSRNKTDHQDIDVNNWEKGLYLVNIQTRENTTVKKVIIN